MSTAGPNGPSTGTGVAAGGPAWVNPGNVTAEDATFSTCTLAAQACNDIVVGTGLGFAIPAGSTINGIVLEVKMKTGGGTSLVGFQLRKTGGSFGAPKSATPTTTNAFVTLGSSADTWGSGATPADINNATFGGGVSGTGAIYTDTFSVDFLRITITYTPASGGPHIVVTGQAVMRAAAR